MLDRNFKIFQERFGSDCFDFIPESFTLPEERHLLEDRLQRDESIWIVKPVTGYGGQGIKIVTKANEIVRENDAKVIVQRYLENPFLISGLKFDIRLYALITCIDPLTLYLYNDGLVRFASVKFSTDRDNLNNKFIHITNSSVNKMNPHFLYNRKINGVSGHKWTFKALLKYLNDNGHNTTELWGEIRRITLKTILCAREEIIKNFKSVKSDYTCYKLLGLDIMLDSSLKPWLLEVNNFPSFEPEELDRSVNEHLLVEMFNIAGFHVTEPLDPQTRQLLMKKMKMESFENFRPETYLRNDENSPLYVNESSLLNEFNLTLKSVKILTRFEEEINQTSNFSILFLSEVPSLASCQTKADKLLMSWEATYGKDRTSGRELLIKLCNFFKVSEGKQGIN